MSVLTNWCADEITVVVATSAFGLGVNKADVRHVFHVGIPDSLECWIQEAVRADRDGKKCDGKYKDWKYKYEHKHVQLFYSCVKLLCCMI